jgi:PPOX class probable F420-dependent enzyme
VSVPRATRRNRPTMNGPPPATVPPRQGRGLVSAVILLFGLLSVAAGIWTLGAPRSFADFVEFPFHEHFLHDVGAFQMGIGVTLLLALAWRDGPALALAGFLAGNTIHAVNHAVDLDLGGRALDPWLLATMSLLALVALVIRLRQLGWVVGEVMTTAASPALEPFVRQKTIQLTTYRRDGSAVGAPVSIVVDGGRAFIRSPARGGKVKRIRNNPTVAIAPSTARGRPTGTAVTMRARRLDGAESRHAAHLLNRKHPLLQGVTVPLIHRLFRERTGGTAHFELTPLQDESRDGPDVRPAS